MDSRVVNALAAISVATFLFLGFGGGLGILSSGSKANAGGGGAVQADTRLPSGGHSETVAKLER